MVCYNRNLRKRKYLNGDEFPITFKVNYISEDLLPVTVTSCFYVEPIVNTAKNVLL